MEREAEQGGWINASYSSSSSQSVSAEDYDQEERAGASEEHFAHLYTEN